MTPEQQADVRGRMQDIGHAVDERLPEGFGFFVLVAPFNDPAGHSNYVSNITRETAIHLIKEWLIKAGAEEDWMKHIT